MYIAYHCIVRGSYILKEDTSIFVHCVLYVSREEEAKVT